VNDRIQAQPPTPKPTADQDEYYAVDLRKPQRGISGWVWVVTGLGLLLTCGGTMLTAAFFWLMVDYADYASPVPPVPIAVAEAEPVALDPPHPAVAQAAVTLEAPVGIVTKTGFQEMIPAGKPLPLTFSQSFVTGDDNQKDIRITLAQQHGSEIKEIATATTDGLPPKPKGVLLVDVAFTVNANKELRVKATAAEANLQKEFGPFAVK
jgi:hypothetical protein